MAEEEKLTGITEQQLSRMGKVNYEGREAQIFNYEHSPDDMSAAVKLVIEQVEHWWLYGYISKEREFIELDREREN
jgi:hypothetical protein